MSESVAVLNPPAEAGAALGPRATVAMWFGALFLIIIVQCAVGGFVRLSGSGLSIPDWPLINGDSLIPVFSDAEWMLLKDKMQDDYERLVVASQSGSVGIGMLQPPPQDLSTFKTMFMIEWSHRAIVSFISVIALACFVTSIVKKEVRQRLGFLPASILLVIAFQAILGGILVLTGTNTSFLFIHLALAAVLLSQTLWAILKLLQDDLTPVADPVREQRARLKRAVHLTAGLVLVQLMLGALVAGSKHHGFSSDWPLMNNQLVPYGLWDGNRGVFWNLFENNILHQWVHRWFAWIVVVAFVVMFVISRRMSLSPRLSLAIKVSGSFLAMQIVLGISNVFFSAEEMLVALAHLLMAMFIIVCLVLAVFDLKYEKPTDEDVDALGHAGDADTAHGVTT